MTLYVARRAQREGLYLEMEGTKDKPNLMFLLHQVSANHLDELVRSELEKQGIKGENIVTGIIEKAEKAYELRVKTEEAVKELRRLMLIKAQGGKLMQKGRRKWMQVFYPAHKRTGVAKEV